jgi:hypothetical protein
MDEQANGAELDDSQAIAGTLRLTKAIAAPTARYEELNQEMNRRETLRWMPP